MDCSSFSSSSVKVRLRWAATLGRDIVAASNGPVESRYRCKIRLVLTEGIAEWEAEVASQGFARLERPYLIGLVRAFAERGSLPLS